MDSFKGPTEKKLQWNSQSARFAADIQRGDGQNQNRQNNADRCSHRWTLGELSPTPDSPYRGGQDSMFTVWLHCAPSGLLSYSTGRSTTDWARRPGGRYGPAPGGRRMIQHMLNSCMAQDVTVWPSTKLCRGPGGESKTPLVRSHRRPSVCSFSTLFHSFCSEHFLYLVVPIARTPNRLACEPSKPTQANYPRVAHRHQ